MTGDDSALRDRHASADMLLESIHGGWMTRRERLKWGTLGALLFLWKLVLVVAPLVVYENYGFEPGVMAALFVITLGVYADA